MSTLTASRLRSLLIYFRNLADAAAAYDKASRSAYGEFARSA